jgi:hypothetical protein
VAAGGFRKKILFAVLLAVEVAALPVAINIATESLPDSWRPYLWIAWPLVVLATLGLAISGLGNRAATNIPASAPIQANSADSGGTVFGVQGGRQIIHPPPQPQRGPADDGPPETQNP